MTSIASHKLWKFVGMIYFLSLTVCVQAQHIIRDNGQFHFKKTLPAGNYSGIAHIKDDIYALVDDKAPCDGFRTIRIDIDTVSGKILNVENIYQNASHIANRDSEGIAYIPDKHSVVVVGEQDSQLIEYDMDGKLTGRRHTLPEGVGNAGYESLTYDSTHRMYLTCTEGPLPCDVSANENKKNYLLRLQALSSEMIPSGEWLYQTDIPEGKREKAKNYAFGVSELTVVGDSSLLVLEREFYVPKALIGAWVSNKLFKVRLPYVRNDTKCNSASQSYVGTKSEENVTVSKQLVYRWRTSLTLFDRSLANYEGMCLGPKLADGSQTLILVSDSQNQSHGVLHDWFRTLVIR